MTMIQKIIVEITIDNLFPMFTANVSMKYLPEY